MGKLQLFLNNFYNMTFKGKGAFWGVLLAILLLGLTYAYSERIQDKLKEKKRLFLIVPALLLACFAVLFFLSCRYTPISERAQDSALEYVWEQKTANTANVLEYQTDVKDPASGTAYSQSFVFQSAGKTEDDAAVKDQFIVVVAESDHVFEDYTVTSDDGRAEITFYPDGTYRFHVLETDEEETGTYVCSDNNLLLTKADGTQAKTKLKQAAALTYSSDVPDPETMKPYSQEFSIKDLKGMLPEEGEGVLSEEYSVLSKDEKTELTFRPDGTYRFLVKESSEEETGTYTYVDKALTLVRDSDAEINEASRSKSVIKYKSALEDPGTLKPYSSKFANINVLSTKCVETEMRRNVLEEYTAVSTDGSSAITFFPDGTYRFAVRDSDVAEDGQYMYRRAGLIMSNSEGSEAFWKNFWLQIGWLVFAVIVAIVMIVIYLYNARIKAFLNKHPMIWLLIPAGLLIYFVYVAIGWNMWVSVSDWPDKTLAASYGWGGFGQYAKMFSDSSFWNAVLNTLKLFLIIPVCLLLGMCLALIMDQGLKGTPVFRTLILLPFALSFVVTGLIWQQMFNGTGGILVEFLKLFGINCKVLWKSSDMVMLSIMIIMIWQFSGYVAVIFLAAIKNVPTNIINAGKLDGAYMPRIYRKMIIPQMKGAMGSCITILAMYALRSFDLIISFDSYTNSATTTLPLMMYNEAFVNNNFAYAAAISFFLLVMVLVLILPLTYATNRRKK